MGGEEVSGAGKALEVGAAEEGAAAGVGAVQGAEAGAAAGPQGAAAGAAAGAAFAIAAVECAKLAINLRSTNAALIESERGIAEYNGGIMRSMTELDVGRLQRRIQTGKDVESTTKALVAAQNRLEENVRPIDASLTNVKNWLATKAANTESDVLEFFLGKPAKKAAGDLSPLAQMAKDYADGKHGGRHYPPVHQAPVRFLNK